MPSNGSTDVVETEALSQALGQLESGDTSARLPKNHALPPEVTDRLNGIFDQIQRRERESAARERELGREVDHLNSSTPDLRRATREKRELLRALTAVEDGDFSTRIESKYVDTEIAGA